jgi:S1-C subfamily serine protease
MYTPPLLLHLVHGGGQMSAELIELSNALVKATDHTALSVVAVHTEARGSSSGVIWRPGVIVTTEHALRRDEEIQATLPDGRMVPATLAGRDPSTDLAVLKCPDAGPASAEQGDAVAIKPGSITLVVGRTRASGPVAALGVVSLVVSERQTWSGSSLAPYIRLDVGLQPTAVGGAVVDAHGKVLGIASPRFARFGAIAIPAATVDRVAETLLQKGRIPRGYLGVALQPVRLPDHLRQSLQHKEKTAVIILEVEPNGPAHKAGIVIGDILVSLAGQSISRPENVQPHLQGENIGKSLNAKVVRGGAVRDVSISVGDRANGAE